MYIFQKFIVLFKNTKIISITNIMIQYDKVGDVQIIYKIFRCNLKHIFN